MNKLLLVLLLCCSNAFSDVTGAGDAVLFGELKLQTANMVKSLEEFRKMVDLQERLKEVEELKNLKKLTAEGAALRNSVYNLRELSDGVQDLQNDPLGLNQSRDELDNIKSLYEQAKSEGAMQKAATYGRLLSDLGTLTMLEEANKQNRVSMGEDGSNQEDNTRTAAQSMLSMETMMIKKEKLEAEQRFQQTEAVEELWKGNSYGGMGDLSDMEGGNDG